MCYACIFQKHIGCFSVKLERRKCFEPGSCYRNTPREFNFKYIFFSVQRIRLGTRSFSVVYYGKIMHIVTEQFK